MYLFPRFQFGSSEAPPRRGNSGTAAQSLATERRWVGEGVPKYIPIQVHSQRTAQLCICIGSVKMQSFHGCGVMLRLCGCVALRLALSRHHSG